MHGRNSDLSVTMKGIQFYRVFIIIFDGPCIMPETVP